MEKTMEKTKDIETCTITDKDQNNAVHRMIESIPVVIIEPDGKTVRKKHIPAARLYDLEKRQEELLQIRQSGKRRLTPMENLLLAYVNFVVQGVKVGENLGTLLPDYQNTSVEEMLYLEHIVDGKQRRSSLPKGNR